MKYKEDYEKAKGSADYNVLPATENPMLRHLKAVANNVNDVSMQFVFQGMDLTKQSFNNSSLFVI